MTPPSPTEDVTQGRDLNEEEVARALAQWAAWLNPTPSIFWEEMRLLCSDAEEDHAP
jgi:hypothetical protein